LKKNRKKNDEGEKEKRKGETKKEKGGKESLAS